MTSFLLRSFTFDDLLEELEKNLFLFLSLLSFESFELVCLIIVLEAFLMAASPTRKKYYKDNHQILAIRKNKNGMIHQK